MLKDRDTFISDRLNEETDFKHSLIGGLFTGIFNIFKWVGRGINKDAKKLILRGKGIEWLKTEIIAMDKALTIYNNSDTDSKTQDDDSPEESDTDQTTEATPELKPTPKTEKVETTLDVSYKVLHTFYIDFCEPLVELSQKYRKDIDNDNQLKSISDYDPHAVIDGAIERFNRDYPPFVNIMKDDAFIKSVVDYDRKHNRIYDFASVVNEKLKDGGGFKIYQGLNEDKLLRYLKGMTFISLCQALINFLKTLGEMRKKQKLTEVLTSEQFMLLENSVAAGLGSFDKLIQKIENTNYPKDEKFRKIATDLVNIRMLKIIEFESTDICRRPDDTTNKYGNEARVDNDLKAIWERYKLKSDEAVRLFIDVDDIYNKVSTLKLSAHDTDELNRWSDESKIIEAFTNIPTIKLHELIQKNSKDIVLLKCALGDKAHDNRKETEYVYAMSHIIEEGDFSWFRVFGVYKVENKAFVRVDRPFTNSNNQDMNKSLANNHEIYAAFSGLQKKNTAVHMYVYFYTKDGQAIINGNTTPLTTDYLAKLGGSMQTVEDSGSRYVAYTGQAFYVPEDQMSRFGLDRQEIDNQKGRFSVAQTSNAAFAAYIAKMLTK